MVRLWSGGAYFRFDAYQKKCRVTFMKSFPSVYLLEKSINSALHYSY